MSIAELESHSLKKHVATICTHCDLPVPAGLIEESAAEQFCCGGCRVAYRIIHDNGLDAYYSMAENGTGRSIADRLAGGAENRFKEFDQPTFLSTFGGTTANDVNEINLLLDGIHCAACVWLIEKLPRIVPGVLAVQLNWARQTVKLRWRQTDLPLSKIAKALHQLGYTPHPIRESEHQRRRQRENRRHLVRMGAAAAIAGNNMLIAISLYLAMFSYMSGGINQLLRIASCILGLVALAWPGRVFLQGAISAIRTRTPHMDLPIALGLTIGTIAGLVNTIRGTGEIWFDSLSVLIFLLLVGRWVQFRQQNQAADSVELLYRLTPSTARKLVDGCVVETFVELVQTDDQLEVRPGDVIPVDAVIVEGSTEVDESILSGESRPVPKKSGQEVLAGTQNGKSTIVVVATATGRETRLSKIVELVEQAALDKPQIVQWANRIGGHFAITVIILAMITLGTWLWIDISVAVDRTVALLIVACPCALALATPLAISVATGRSAKQKIMIKGGDVLQRLNQPGIIWLDKTGTLTDGKLEVVQWHGDTRRLTQVAKLEAGSSHPVARAMVDYQRNLNLQPNLFDLAFGLPPTEVVEIVGQGISGYFGADHVLVGNAELMRSNAVSISLPKQRIADRILQENLSPCWVALNQEVVAIAALGDRVRPDTPDAIKQMRAAGWKLGILSGDHETIVCQVARRLEIEQEFALGGRSPEAKTEAIRASRDRFETVVMVGDGVNDSAALAAASVGIAVHNGAEASLAAAPVYLAEQGLQPIVKLLRICQSTGRTMQRTFAVSVAYNLCGATFAAIGWIDPLVAAILMPISSLTVVAVSLNAGKTRSPGAKA